MDLALQQILINTYNHDPTLRTQAENSLKQFIKTPNFISSFVVVIDGYRQNNIQTLHRDIRLAASIVLKNNMRQMWVESEDQSKAKYIITFEEKEYAKESLLNILIAETDNVIRGLLAETIRIICEYDYPQKWPTLLPKLKTFLQSSDVLVLHNALLALRKIVKRYEFRQKDNRMDVDNIIVETFPFIQDLISRLVDNNHLEASVILRLCLKIFWSYVIYVLPSSASPASAVVNVPLWFDIIGKIVEKRLPEASDGIEPFGQPVLIDERRKWPWWKLKKWAVRLTTHFIQRYGNPSEMSPTYKIIKPHLDFLLFHVVFPLLCLNNTEIQLFQDDPTEFIQKNHSTEDEWLDPRTAAITLLQTLAKYRQKDVIPKLLPFIQSNLSEYNNTEIEKRDYIKKDGILVLVSLIFRLPPFLKYILIDNIAILSESTTYNSLVEPFILHHVIPELTSPVPYLRYRACWVVEYFSGLSFSNNTIILTVTNGLLSGLRDPAPPVQAAAACSLRMMFETSETTELLKPIVKDIIGEYFRIMNEVESDSVLSALQAIIEKFGDDIIDIGPLIVHHLLQIFNQHTNQGEDDDEAAFTATQCLDTITAVIDACQDHPNILLLIEIEVLPLLRKILDDSDNGFEYLDNAIEIICYLSYFSDTIRPDMWSLCPLLINAANDWAYDYTTEIMTPVINFMTRDIVSFINYRFSNNESIVTLMLNFTKKCFENDDQAERESKAAANLLSCLISTAKSIQSSQSIVELFIPILTLTTNRLNNCKTTALRIKLLEILLSMIYYDASVVLSILNNDVIVRDNIFHLMFTTLTSMSKTYSQRLIILAFSNIFTIPSDQLPEILRNNLQAMLQQIIREIVLLQENEAKEKDEHNISNDDEELDEEYGDIAVNDEDDDDDDISDDDDDDDKDDIKNSKRSNIPEGGFDEDEDCLNADDEAYKEVMEKMDKEQRIKNELYRAGQEVVDDEDDDEELAFTSPIENINIIHYFLNNLQIASNREPNMISLLRNNLDTDDTNRLNTFMSS